MNLDYFEVLFLITYTLYQFNYIHDAYILIEMIIYIPLRIMDMYHDFCQEQDKQNKRGKQ